MLENPRFIQGTFTFTGRGLETPVALEPAASYTVPYDRRSQLIYFRAGNSTPEMIYVLLKRNHRPMRYFPIGGNGAIHVPLAVVEDLTPETQLEILIGAPEGISGVVVLDIGFVEI